MNLAAERTLLKGTMRNIKTLNVQDLTDAPAVPAAMVYPSVPFDIHDTFGDDTVKHRFVVWILVPYTDTESAQAQLDDFLATDADADNSVILAIEAVNRFEVLQLLTYGVTSLQDGGTRYLSAELLVNSFGP